MNIKEARIWQIASTYRSFVLGDDIVPATIRMVFSKYLVDNYLFAESAEDMKFYADAQKAISSGDAFAYINSIQPIVEMVGMRIHSGDLLKDLPHQMADDLFGGYNKRKTFDSGAASRAFMDIIRIADFSQNDMSLFDGLTEFIYSSMERVGKRGGESVTSRSINKLAARILKVNENDSYKDFACGYGLSSYEIITESLKRGYLSDINQENIQIALILAIIQNKNNEKLSFEVANVFNRDERNTPVTKLFVDFPYNLKIEKFQYGTSDGNVVAISKIIDSLEQGGTAVFTCPSGMLFKETKEVVECRKKLAEQGLIEAVITLPPLSYSTSINTNLLVLSKKENKNVVVIDASDNKYFQFSNNARSSKSELTKEGIERIIEIYNNKQEFPGISKVVVNSELIEKNTFVPASHIDVPKRKAPISSEEIYNRLNELYDKLRELH